MTHVWDDLRLQNIFICVMCLKECVQRFMVCTGSKCIVGMISHAVYRCYGCNCREMRNHSDLKCQTKGPGIARISYLGGGSVSRHRTGKSLPCDRQMQYL